MVLYEPYEPLTKEQAIEEAIYRSRNHRFFAVCLKETNQLIGNVYFAVESDTDEKTYTLGYVFHPDFQRKGYATEACQALLDYGFNTLKLEKIIAGCNEKNERSWKLMERIGMKKVESKRHKPKHLNLDENKPIWIDSVHYAITYKEYIERKAVKHE